MYKATASGQQFFAREAMHSTKGSRRGFDLLEHGCNVLDVLTDEQRRENLVKRVQGIQKTIAETPKTLQNAAFRQGLILEQTELNAQIHEIRAKRKGKRDIGEYFITACKARFSKPILNLLWEEAKRLQQEDEAK